MIESIETGLLSNDPDPEYWVTLFSALTAMARRMTIGMVVCPSILDICLVAMTGLAEDPLGFSDAFCRIVECCTVLVRRDPNAERERLIEFRKLAFRGFRYFQSEDTCFWVVVLFTDLRRLTPPLHERTPKRLQQLLEFVAGSSHRQTSVAMIELLTLSLPVFPEFLHTVKEFKFINRVFAVLSTGSLAEKMSAGRFFSLLTDPAFFQEERPAFIDGGVVYLLIDLLVAAGSTQENLALIAGLHNILCDLKRTQSDPRLLIPFYNPDLTALIANMAFADNDELRVSLSAMLSSLRELDPSYLVQ
jgi:hypothetical protein